MEARWFHVFRDEDINLLLSSTHVYCEREHRGFCNVSFSFGLKQYTNQQHEKSEKFIVSFTNTEEDKAF